MGELYSGEKWGSPGQAGRTGMHEGSQERSDKNAFKNWNPACGWTTERSWSSWWKASAAHSALTVLSLPLAVQGKVVDFSNTCLLWSLWGSNYKWRLSNTPLVEVPLLFPSPSSPTLFFPLPSPSCPLFPFLCLLFHFDKEGHTFHTMDRMLKAPREKRERRVSPPPHFTFKRSVLLQCGEEAIGERPWGEVTKGTGIDPAGNQSAWAIF